MAARGAAVAGGGGGCGSLEDALHNCIAPIKLGHGSRCRRLRAGTGAAMYREQATTTADVVEHGVCDAPVVARGKHTDATLAVHVHCEVGAADERVGDVVAVVNQVCAHWHSVCPR